MQWPLECVCGCGCVRVCVWGQWLTCACSGHGLSKVEGTSPPRSPIYWSSRYSVTSSLLFIEQKVNNYNENLIWGRHLVCSVNLCHVINDERGCVSYSGWNGWDVWWGGGGGGWRSRDEDVVRMRIFRRVHLVWCRVRCVGGGGGGSQVKVRATPPCSDWLAMRATGSRGFAYVIFARSGSWGVPLAYCTDRSQSHSSLSDIYNNEYIWSYIYISWCDNSNIVRKQIIFPCFSTFYFFSRLWCVLKTWIHNHAQYYTSVHNSSHEHKTESVCRWASPL